MRELFLTTLRRFRDLGTLQCDVGAVGLILSAWVRYAGTARSLSPNSAYALLIVGQVIPGYHLSYYKRLPNPYPSFSRPYPKQSIKS